MYAHYALTCMNTHAHILSLPYSFLFYTAAKNTNCGAVFVLKGLQD